MLGPRLAIAPSVDSSVAWPDQHKGRYSDNEYNELQRRTDTRVIGKSVAARSHD